MNRVPILQMFSLSLKPSEKASERESESICKIGHLRFEEAFELKNLDLLLFIDCCNSLCLIYIYTFKKSTRGFIQETLDSSRHT